MELSDLAVFRAVVEAGGVTRAAERLHRVQSNVTTRVQKLEAELGVALFVREGRRMQLSAAGKVLLDYAVELQALADRARAALRNTGPGGTLRLGAMESTAAIRLPAPLSELQCRHRDLAIELSTGDPAQLTAQVLAGALDAALVAEPVADARLEALPVYVEEVVIVTAAAHPPVNAPRDLAVRTVLAFPAGCPHRQRLEEWFARGALQPDRILEMGSYHAILGCAVVGMGVALMPKSVLDDYAERARLRINPMKRGFDRVRTLLVWRRDAPQANIAALAEALLAHAPKLAATTRQQPTRVPRRPRSQS